MNITIDKEKKTITIYEEVKWSDLVHALEDEDVFSVAEIKNYKLIPPPKEIQYIPVYSAAPIMPQIVPYPVPYPCTPYPYWSPYTVTCKVQCKPHITKQCDIVKCNKQFKIMKAKPKTNMDMMMKMSEAKKKKMMKEKEEMKKKAQMKK